MRNQKAPEGYFVSEFHIQDTRKKWDRVYHVHTEDGWERDDPPLCGKEYGNFKSVGDYKLTDEGLWSKTTHGLQMIKCRDCRNVLDRNTGKVSFGHHGRRVLDAKDALLLIPEWCNEYSDLKVGDCVMVERKGEELYCRVMSEPRCSPEIGVYPTPIGGATWRVDVEWIDSPGKYKWFTVKFEQILYAERMLEVSF